MSMEEQIATINQCTGDALLKRLNVYPEKDITKVRNYGLYNLWKQQDLDAVDSKDIQTIKQHLGYSILGIATANIIVKNTFIRSKIDAGNRLSSLQNEFF